MLPCQLAGLGSSNRVGHEPDSCGLALDRPLEVPASGGFPHIQLSLGAVVHVQLKVLDMYRSIHAVDDYFMWSASEKLEGHGRVHFLPELGAPNVAVQVAHESIPLLHLRPHSHVLSLNLHRLSPTEVQPPMIAVGHAMGPLQAHVVVGLAAVIPKIGDARRWQCDPDEVPCPNDCTLIEDPPPGKA